MSLAYVSPVTEKNQYRSKAGYRSKAVIVLQDCNKEGETLFIVISCSQYTVKKQIKNHMGMSTCRKIAVHS